MTLMRVDCHVYRGPLASTEGSSFVALGATRVPGSLVVAASTAVRESIGGQVACRLSLEHFVSGALGYFDGVRDDSQDIPRSMPALELAFKNANDSVYAFGHKLAAGGRMAASLVGIVAADRSLAAGRVGLSGAYLFRRGEVFPFFERRTPDENSRSQLATPTVGSQSTVAVELASVPIESGDLVILLPHELSLVNERELREICAEEADARLVGEHGVGFCRRLCRALYAESDRLAFGFVARFGQDSIYLDKAVAEVPRLSNGNPRKIAKRLFQPV